MALSERVPTHQARLHFFRLLSRIPHEPVFGKTLFGPSHLRINLDLRSVSSGQFGQGCYPVRKSGAPVGARLLVSESRAAATPLDGRAVEASLVPDRCQLTALGSLKVTLVVYELRVRTCLHNEQPTTRSA